ncbi:CIA30 family protein [Verrucomicrobiaceae bacterium R5-34]|nr:CIA30 family protein [Verrucomicrobiaceae bacterium R5-34]
MNTIIFNSLFLLAAGNLFAQADPPPTKTLDDFQTKQSADRWMSVNDGVMGGLSQGKPSFDTSSKLLFKGAISLENNGGFSSICTRRTNWDLSDYHGIELRVKGDGRMYYLTARSGGGRMLAFWSPIQPPKDEWTVIRVPFDTFYATYFGKKIPALNLNTQKVSSVGFMLYDKKDGAFALEVDSIKVYRDEASVK